ncbi:MAG: cytochrome b/b6 domain-containing protein [Caldimonas sp.]
MIAVWDRAVRVLHWALVASVALAWVTTEWAVGWHRPLGYIALAIVGVRLAWGFFGSPYARFRQFMRGPVATWRHARLVLGGREPRYIGHNPLGAWMVTALMACVGALALTGWLYRTDRFWGDETIEAIHVGVAWTFVLLIVIHIVGVVHASRRHRENLVVSMIDGRKRGPRNDDVA